MLPDAFIVQLTVTSILPLVMIAASLVLSGKERLSSRVLLALILLVIATLTTTSIVMSNNEMTYAFPLAHFGNLSVGLLGPLYYYYLRSLLERRFVFRPAYLLAFLPVVVPVLALVYFVLSGQLTTLKRFNFIEYKFAETLWLAAWWVLAPLAARRAGTALRAFFFDFTSLRLTWLRLLYLLLAVIWLNKVYLFLQYTLFLDYPRYLQGVSVYFVAVGVFLSFLLFVALNRQRFFTGARAAHADTDASRDKRLFAKLEALMERERLYLDPDLGLFSLAERVGISAKELSRVVNAESGGNFNEYLNRLRVEHACGLLEGDDKILAVLLDSGFRSKSVFNAAFKKYRGVTPAEFRKKRYGIMLQDDSRSTGA